MECYLVGGAVRDKLLNRAVSERDWVVVGATPDDLLNMGYRSVGKGFPVFLAPGTNEEYALAREERKVDHGHTGFICSFAPNITLEQDLLRRDLTINAMAQPAEFQGRLARLKSTTVIDPLNAIKDLKNRILRHVSPAFNEDPLRVLRVARFYAQLSPWDFGIASETMQLMTNMASGGELTSLTAERVWRETQLALNSANPNHYFATLVKCGALVAVYPEITIKDSSDWHKSLGAKLTEKIIQKAGIRFSNESIFAILVVTAAVGTIKEYAGSHARSVLQSLRQKAIPKTYITHATDLTHCLDVLINHKPTALEVLDLFKHLKLFQAPLRFEKITPVLQQMDRLTDSRWPLALLKLMLKSALQVKIEDFINSGLTGVALGEALQKSRLQAIEGYIEPWESWQLEGPLLDKFGPVKLKRFSE